MIRYRSTKEKRQRLSASLSDWNDDKILDEITEALSHQQLKQPRKEIFEEVRRIGEKRGRVGLQHQLAQRAAHAVPNLPERRAEIVRENQPEPLHHAVRRQRPRFGSRAHALGSWRQRDIGRRLAFPSVLRNSSKTRTRTARDLLARGKGLRGRDLRVVGQLWRGCGGPFLGWVCLGGSLFSAR